MTETGPVALGHRRAAGALPGTLPLLLLAAAALQVLVAPRLAPPGATPDLLLVATAAVAASAPARTAAGFGFAAGLSADLLAATPFGLCGAAFTAVAQAGAGLDAPGRAVGVAPRAVLSAGLAGALVMFSAAALGAAPAPTGESLRLLLRSALTAGALAPPFLVLLRRLGMDRRPG